MQLIEQIEAAGLQWRGACRVLPSDQLPALPGAEPATVLAMVGIAGSAFWPHFRASEEFQDGQPEPLDRWSRRLGLQLAQIFGGQALFPFDGPPFWPFQQWADRCEPSQPSPLMLRIHPQYGLWHAYRFALAMPASMSGLLTQTPPTPATAATDICANCSGQPCLQACPVAAFDGNSYAAIDCAKHLQGAGGSECMKGGCLARRACPVGSGFQYAPEHAAFHMQAFVRSFGALC